MTLHADLLRQAATLAILDPRRPQQANLRRSISASYYALFHMLTDEAAARLVRGTNRQAHRNYVRRRFEHGPMRRIAKAWVQPSIPQWLADSGISPGTDLRLVASAFERLQELRHRADYDHATSFARADAQAAIELTEEAFAAWGRIRTEPAADFFLITLLLPAR